MESNKKTDRTSEPIKPVISYISNSTLVLALLAVAILFFMFFRALKDSLFRKKKSLDSRTKRLHQIIDKKTKLNTRLNRIVDIAAFIIRAFMVGLLALFNYLVGHEHLGLTRYNLDGYLALNAALGFAVSCLSFVLFGSLDKLKDLIFESKEYTKKFLIKEKWYNLSEDIEAHREDLKNILEEKEQVSKALSELDSIYPPHSTPWD